MMNTILNSFIPSNQIPLGGPVEIQYTPKSINEREEGVVPRPLPACLDWLPWEETEHQRKIREDKRKRDEINYQQQKQLSQNRNQGYMDQFLSFGNDVVFNTTMTVSNSVDSATLQLEEKINFNQKHRYLTHYSSFFPITSVSLSSNSYYGAGLSSDPLESPPSYSPPPYYSFPSYLPPSVYSSPPSLWYEYYVSVISGKQAFSGYLWVTTNFLSFYSSSQFIILKFIIPFSSILSIQHGYSLPLRHQNSEKNQVPHIQLILNPEVRANALLLYTEDQKVHEIYNIQTSHDPLSNFHDHAFNVIDHAFRNDERNNNNTSQDIIM